MCSEREVDHMKGLEVQGEQEEREDQEAIARNWCYNCPQMHHWSLQAHTLIDARSKL